jgi:hypothetical protein
MKFKTLILLGLIISAWIGPVAGAEPSANHDVIPLIEMENVLLPDAIRQLARQAHINYVLDPRLSELPYSRYTVSIRWQNVTAREALVALLDNYGLKLVEL